MPRGSPTMSMIASIMKRRDAERMTAYANAPKLSLNPTFLRSEEKSKKIARPVPQSPPNPPPKKKEKKKEEGTKRKKGVI